MKKILIAAALLICSHSFAQWPWEKVEGNGRIKKENRQVDKYHAIASSGSWDVKVAYGESNTVQVEADENLQEYIETKVENDRLSIRAKKNVNLRSKNKITIYIMLTRLTGVSLSGSGDIMGEGKFENDGTSEFRLSGSGNIRLSFDKLKNVELSISGSGNIHLSGATNNVSATISGSGNADCSDLVSEDFKASISGSGNVKANANKSIDAKIAGSGNVYYKGAATDIQKHIAGSGRVIRL